MPRFCAATVISTSSSSDHPWKLTISSDHAPAQEDQQMLNRVLGLIQNEGVEVVAVTRDFSYLVEVL